jgi:tetratricopeptide (TPR) repeat protein
MALHKNRRTNSTPKTDRCRSLPKGIKLLHIFLLVAALMMIYRIHLRPVYADMDFRRAMDLQRQGRIRESISFLKKAHILSPKQSAYGTALGQAYLKLGSKSTGLEHDTWITKAETALHNVLRKNPMDPQHHLNMGALYTAWGSRSHGVDRKRRFEKAWEFYKRALTMKPMDHEYYLAWAKSLLVGGEIRQAQVLLQHISNLAPFPPVFLSLGEIYLQQGNWARAKDAYDSAIEQEPESVEAHSGLGYALAKMNRLEEAALAYQSAIFLAPERYNDYKNLALVYKDLGFTGEAVHCLRQALAVAPEEKREAIYQNMEGLSPSDSP